MKTTMIVTGGLSGGISSAIAGGNFWDGFKQGIISAGLNHVAHIVTVEIEESILKSQMKKKYDLDGKPDLSQEGIIKMITSLPELKRIFNLTDEKAKFIVVEKIYSSVRGGVTLGETIGRFIYLSRSAILNNFDLALTLGHEMIHVYHNLYYRSKWRAEYRDESGRRSALISEIEAHTWSLKMGDPYAEGNITFYSNRLQNDFKIKYKAKEIF